MYIKRFISSRISLKGEKCITTVICIMYIKMLIMGSAMAVVVVVVVVLLVHYPPVRKTLRRYQMRRPDQTKAL